MPKLPLSQTVDASRSESSWRSSALTLATSTVVQGLAITTLIVTPLLVAQTLPEPVSPLTMPHFIPARMEPPLARQPHRTPPGPKHHPAINLDVFVPPTNIPNTIPEGASYFSQNDPIGVDGGLPSSLGGKPLPTDPEPRPKPEPNPDPIIIIGSLRPPKKITHVNPVYPPIAAKARMQGIVKLQAVIDARGHVADLTVIQSIPLLDGAAIEAVKKWRYQPTILNGRAVPVIMTVEVEFRLR